MCNLINIPTYIHPGKREISKFRRNFGVLAFVCNDPIRALLLLLFLTFSVLVANPKKLLYTVANPARGLLNREKRTKEKVWQHTVGKNDTLLLYSSH